MEYLKFVRDTFGSRNDSRYRGFLRVMKDYKEGTYVHLFSSSFYFPPTFGFVFVLMSSVSLFMGWMCLVDEEVWENMNLGGYWRRETKPSGCEDRIWLYGYCLNGLGLGLE